MFKWIELRCKVEIKNAFCWRVDTKLLISDKHLEMKRKSCYKIDNYQRTMIDVVRRQESNYLWWYREWSESFDHQSCRDTDSNWLTTSHHHISQTCSTCHLICAVNIVTIKVKVKSPSLKSIFPTAPKKTFGHNSKVYFDLDCDKSSLFLVKYWTS